MPESITITYDEYTELQERKRLAEIQANTAINSALELRRLVQQYIKWHYQSQSRMITDPNELPGDPGMDRYEFVERAEDWISRHKWYNTINPLDSAQFIHEQE